jgi:hypothetical protein
MLTYKLNNRISLALSVLRDVISSLKLIMSVEVPCKYHIHPRADPVPRFVNELVQLVGHVQECFCVLPFNVH